jgi:DNA-binding transcriptional MerR regulator
MLTACMASRSMTLEEAMSEAAAATAKTVEIPDKLYFRIGEVGSLLSLEPYVLRYWETEFPSLAPKKSASGHRLYRRKDVELLLKIKQLLYEKRYTIDGAKQFLQTERKATPAIHAQTEQPDLFASEILPGIRKELVAIVELLK